MPMNLRTILPVLAVVLSVGAAVAQSDPVKTREDLMKQNNEHAKTVVQMMKGQKPFDSKAVEAAFAQWAETAQKLPSLFPDNAKTGGDNRASPKIWENKNDFEAKAAAFGKAIADNRAKAIASLDGLKAAIPVVGKGCDNCHENYRLSRR
jgi:cytochrome c556